MSQICAYARDMVKDSHNYGGCIIIVSGLYVSLMGSLSKINIIKNRIEARG